MFSFFFIAFDRLSMAELPWRIGKHINFNRIKLYTLVCIEPIRIECVVIFFLCSNMYLEYWIETEEWAKYRERIKYVRAYWRCSAADCASTRIIILLYICAHMWSSVDAVQMSILHELLNKCRPTACLMQTNNVNEDEVGKKCNM